MNTLNTLWIVIFIAAATQGVFLGFLLLINNRKSQRLLAMLIFTFSICLFYYTAFWAGILDQLPSYFGISMGLTYLFGPLLYFYIKSGRGKPYVSLWHLIPFLLFVILFLYQSYVAEQRVSVLVQLQIIIQNVHLFFYVALIYRYIRQSVDHNTELRRWRLQLLIAFAGYAISFLSYYVLVWTNLLKIEYDYAISLAAAGFIYFVGYKGFTNPNLLHSYDHNPYQKTALSDQAAQSILNKVKEYFHQEKPYRESQLRLPDVADHIHASTHQLSQVMNEFEGQSFTDFVNSYRIQEAKSLLGSKRNEHLRIIDIAYDCGFNNKTTFNNAFKKHEGMSPSAYRNRLRDQQSL